MENTANETSPLLPPPTRNGNVNKNNVNKESAYNINSASNTTATEPASHLETAIIQPSSNKINPSNKNVTTSVTEQLSTTTKVSGNNKTEPEVKIYKRRWYILVMFSLFSNVQMATWMTWPPIASSSERVFGWTDSTIAWLNNYGPIAYMVAGIIFPWFLQVKGLRAAILGSSLLMSIGCTFRVISSNPSTCSVLIHIGQFINGAAGPIGMGAMPYLSATWFPVNERVTATAIASSVGFFGAAVSFVVGPSLVSESDISTTINKTHFDAIVEKEKGEIMNYMYYSCSIAWAITIIMLIYFPARPPLPPCISANVQRDDFWDGILSLRRKRYFICIAISYGLSIGVFNNWTGLIKINLGHFNVSQSDAGWIGFFATVSSCVTSIIVGKFANHFVRLLKIFIFVMYVIGASIFLVFTLMFVGVVPYSSVLLYVTIISGSATIHGTVPLIFELACELAFPTGEGLVTGVLTYINNIFALLFLVLISTPGIGKTWMNWILVGSIVVSLPMVWMLKGNLKRLEIDQKEADQSLQ